MRKIGRREKQAAWAISFLLGAAIVITAAVTLQGQPLLDDCLFFAVMIVCLPPAVVYHVEHRWKKAVDEYLPDLFRSVVQAQQTGMTLPQALEEASKRDYGPLTDELRTMVNQMSWGLSFDEALQAFSNRVSTLLVQRTVPLITEASRAGGRVEKVFAPMGNFIQTSLLMEKERNAQTRPYIIIIYVAFFVFVVTVVLLFKTFFVGITRSPIIGLSTLTSETAWRLFFHMGALQAFFGGLVAGKMGEGTVTAGLKHSVILMIVGYAALKLTVG